jgi:hypothetical protein
MFVLAIVKLEVQLTNTKARGMIINQIIPFGNTDELPTIFTKSGNTIRNHQSEIRNQHSCDIKSFI